MRLNIPVLGGGEKCGRGMLTALLCFLSLSKGYACGDFSLPQTHFEGVSEKGSVSHWEQLGSLDLGDIKVPLIIGFQTYLPYTSPELGAGWTLALFDSNMVQRDEGTFDMVRPDGSWEIFQRDGTTPNILHGSGGLLAEINGDIITVNSTCGSGWKMVFNQGKLVSLGKSGHTLNIVRDPLGRATDLMDGPTRVLTLEQDQGTGLTKSIAMGDKKFELSYDAKPRVERVNGVNLVGGVDQSLHKITFADGKSETYDFAVTDKMLPNLKITDAQGKERMIVWGTDGKIIRDGEWTYTIKPQEDPTARFATIERKNAAGQSELWNKDESKGEEVTQGLDGVKTVKTWFTSGVLAGRQRKEEAVSKGETRIVYKAIYDDSGKLLREINFGEAPILYKYDEKGRQIGAVSDDKDLWKRTYDSYGRIKDEVLENGTSIYYRYLNDNSIEKRVLEKSGSRFVQIFRENREIRREMGNGTVENYEYDNKGRLSTIRDDKNDRRSFKYGENGEVIEEYKNDVLFYKIFTDTTNRSRLKVIYGQDGAVATAWDWVNNKEYDKISTQEIYQLWKPLS